MTFTPEDAQRDAKTIGYDAKAARENAESAKRRAYDFRALADRADTEVGHWYDVEQICVEKKR